MATTTTLHCFCSPNPINNTTFNFSLPKISPSFANPNLGSIISPTSIPRLVSNNYFGLLKKLTSPLLCGGISTFPTSNTHYEFSDGGSEVELRLELGNGDMPSSGNVYVDAEENSLTIRVRDSGSHRTLMETTTLYDKIKPGETIWYLDEDQLVVNLKKQDAELKWPDIVESWESLTVGVMQLLKGTSIYLVGDSTEINQKIAQELAVGLGYTPLITKELLETFAKQTIDSYVLHPSLSFVVKNHPIVAPGSSGIIESVSRDHIRSVVATLGQYGAAGRSNNWRHLYSGFTIWLSQSEAADEDSAKEEARRYIQDGSHAYSNADVVVKIGGWDADHSKTVAQASLSALKRLILSDKKLPGKKGLYIRLGCRGDWPNIKPPGWDPSSGESPSF
ncbi:hypothetical protein LguiB_034435 [Lonicera macranthoides]